VGFDQALSGLFFNKQSKEFTMSMMRSKDGCSAKKGMCGHEKMMLGMMIVMAFGAVGHFALGWF